ncbi:MAG: fimbrial protein [Mesorhizobium sp.]|nr:fimbrial protein [Mesorhizobium sp.]MBL8576550.1 fimbrial protein [Mesorhizobium sp.]
MTRPVLNIEEEKPLDPAVEKVRRKLVRFVAINLGLLFAALMIVVAALVYKAMNTAPAPTVVDAGVEIPSPTGVVEGQIVLPAGARIVSQSMSGNRLSLALDLTDGSRAIYIYDLLSKRVVGRFAVTEE